MTPSLLLLVLLLSLAVVLAFANAGCTGDDPKLIGQAFDDGKKVGGADKAEEIKEENRYDATIVKETFLVSYWRLSEQEGAQQAIDIGPKQRHGTYLHTAGISLQQAGALSLTEDPQDRAARFEGTEGFVEVPHAPGLNTVEFSIEFWLQPLSQTVGAEVVLGSYEISPTGDVLSGYVVEVFRETAAGGAISNPKVRIRLGGGGKIEADLGSGIQRAGWRHVAATFQLGNPTSLKVYVDATTGDPAEELDGALYVPLALNAPLRMGAGLSSPGVVGRFYKGGLDEVAFYNGVLTNNVIKTHYQKSFA